MLTRGGHLLIWFEITAHSTESVGCKEWTKTLADEKLKRRKKKYRMHNYLKQKPMNLGHMLRRPFQEKKISKPLCSQYSQSYIG